MPQAWKIKNAPKSCLPKFGYVCPPNFCCTMYTGPIQRALKKKHPRARSCMACSRGQRSNRLQIESGRGSEEGGRHSSLQHSQEDPSVDILRGRVASSEALGTSYQSVAELPSASPLDTPCPRLSELPGKREENKFRVRT